MTLPVMRSLSTHSNNRYRNIALRFVVLVLFILTARWICVMGWTDNGTNYENGYRIYLGQKFGIDFFTNVAPLSFFTLAAFMHLLGTDLWVMHLHLFLWWALAILCGYGLGRVLTDRTDVLGAGVFCAAVISIPITTYGHVYNYASVALVGTAGLLFVRFLKTQNSAPLLFSGLFLGFSLFAKQNVGIFSVAGFFLAAVVTSSSWRQAVRSFLWIAIGFAAGILIWFVILTHESDFQTMMHAVFFDSARGKGGGWLILGRAIPRLTFGSLRNHPVSLVRTLEIITTLGLALLIGRITWKRLSSIEKRTVTPFSLRPMTYILVVFSLVSLIPVPGLMWWPWTQQRFIFNSLTAYVVCAIWIGVATCIGTTVIFFWKNGSVTKNPVLVFFIIFVMTLCFACNTANPLYFCFSGAVVFPSILALGFRYLRFTGFFLNGLSILCVSALYIGSSHAPTFQNLTLFPWSSKFKGLVAPNFEAQQVLWNLRHLPEKLEGRRVIWLVGAGPYSVYGGIPAPNITTLCCDQYPVRSELKLKEKWEEELPDRIVIGSFTPADESPFLGKEELISWVASHYETILEGPNFKVLAMRKSKHQDL